MLSPQAQLQQLIWGEVQPDLGRCLADLGLQGLGGHTAERAFAAYREHAKALSVRALGAAFPRLQSWLGAADFAGLAWAFARAHPPELGDVAQWGRRLPEFLAQLPQMDALPLALALLDWALHRLEAAADEEQSPELVSRLQAGEVDRLRLSQHLAVIEWPEVRSEDWLAFEHDPAAVSLDLGSEPADGPALVWRQGLRPVWARVPQIWVDRLTDLREGLDLEASLMRAEQQAPGWDAGPWLLVALREAWILGPA
ncbi:hypothetical protein HNQ51_001472 [Inhella inkyongensis]|uniref:Putative DNA-binding domain-containing protein n=1 Tax=Inhella inkyongensis TaxID=392593 RepID=A0A840S6T7_9BURK|nr:DNA-binding domain-containing protein [Inhella inkyongensis]MBB5204179.1 hypothetical protein [Inhella inkyongensis]